jgi:hypothetical protein
MEPQNNLSTFKTLFLIKGILYLVASLFFVMYALIGGTAMSHVPNDAHIPFNPGMIFIVIGTVGSIVTIGFGIVTLLASKAIGQRRNYSLIFAAAIMNCLTGILGILLGVFTIIELNKPEVKALFGKS